MSVANMASKPPDSGGRRVQLWLGVVCMALIANLQYAWMLSRARLERGRDPVGLLSLHSD
jgi:hypothetical protein